MNDELTPKRVEELFCDCLYKDEELVDGSIPEDAILVQGLTGRFGLHPGHINGHKAEIGSLLKALPTQFITGGGWSFLNMCLDRDGNQWTGEQRIQELLVVLGIASGQMQYCLPRELWSSLPGGVPYVAVVGVA